MKLGLQITTSGQVNELDLSNEDTALATLQGAVGGWVQALDLSDTVSLWVNEEGKMDGLEHNPYAQVFWDEAFGAGTDFIVGNVVLTGTPDSEGYTQGLDERTAQRIRELLVAS
jgi:hypothetical protein